MTFGTFGFPGFFGKGFPFGKAPFGKGFPFGKSPFGKGTFWI